jgi:hypothetical protein
LISPFLRASTIVRSIIIALDFIVDNGKFVAPSKVLVALTLLAFVWLAAGRQITIFVDKVIHLPGVSLPVTPLKYDGGGLVIGEIPAVFGSLDNQRVDLSLRTDPMHRVILLTRQESFTLGPRTNPIDQSGRPEIDFIAEPGDELSFTARRSLLAWKAPYEFQIFGGRSPRWKRYVYYRLLWKKHAGASLEMVWRYEQQYTAGRGWSAAAMMWNSQTGLVRLKIQPASAAAERAVMQYIARTKGWRRTDYRIEHRGFSAGGRAETIAVIFLEDEHGAKPGAGRSVELCLDSMSHCVTGETGWQ